MRKMCPVTIAVAHGATIDIETKQDYGPPFIYMACQHADEKPYVMTLRGQDVQALHHVLGEWLDETGEPAEAEAKRQFNRGNYSYLARDMHDEGINLDYLTRIVRLIRKYR